MELTGLFLVLTVVMFIAWWGPRTLALTLWAATFIVSLLIHLHHATDALNLSF